MGSRPQAAATGTRGVVSGGADTQAELATAEELKSEQMRLTVGELSRDFLVPIHVPRYL